MCYSYKIQAQNQNPGPSEPKCGCSPPHQLDWAPSASHAGAVRNAVRGTSKVLLQGGHSSTETWKSLWGLGKDQARGTGRFGKPRRGGAGSFIEKNLSKEGPNRWTTWGGGRDGGGGGGEVLGTPTHQSGWGLMLWVLGTFGDF